MAMVADHVGSAVRSLGVEVAFGLVGSGNFFVTHALAREGIKFISTRHECAAVAAADGYGRVTGKVGVASVHTGPGLTNTILGLGEAVKANTPIVVLAADVPSGARGSNSRIDQHDLVESVGAIAERIYSPATAAKDVARAFYRARIERRPVVLMMATDIQESSASDTFVAASDQVPPAAPWPDPAVMASVADLIHASKRPVIVAGRGAVLSDAAADLAALGDRIGALMATSVMGNSLFLGNPWNLGISGGFSTPLAIELIGGADLILGFGATLNQWTTRNGSLLNPGAKVVQIDLKSDVRSNFRAADVQVIGDAAAAARLLNNELEKRKYSSRGYRTDEVASNVKARRFWNDEEFGQGTDNRIDPRALSEALDRVLPADRALSVDGGHFLGYPPMYIRVPNPRAFVFPNAFMPVGLGLGAAIGAAAANPKRPTIAAVGDGGALMALGEFETIARFKLPILIVVYNDGFAGAEAHHYGPLGYDLDIVTFQDTDFAHVGRALGMPAITVHTLKDLAPVADWSKAMSGPMVIDAKIDRSVCAGWLEEAFRNSDHPVKHTTKEEGNSK